MMTGYNMETNLMDGTERHPYMNWNFDPTFLKSGNSYPLHEVDTPEHTNPNRPAPSLSAHIWILPHPAQPPFHM